MRHLPTRALWLGLFLVVFVVLPSWLTAQNKDGVKYRAKPPTFRPGEFDGVFFRDVFSEGTRGARPANLSRATPANPTPGGAIPGTNPGGAAPANTGGVFAWSKIISGDTLENEIKAIKAKVDKDVTTPGKFAGTGCRLCRRHFSILAMSFAIIGEYDGDVRWKKDAPGIRNVFAKTAGNCKVGTPQVFNEAKLRKEELTGLVSGAASSFKAGEAKASWGDVCDRTPLMQRLEIAVQGRLQPMTNSDGEFKGNLDAVQHEADIVAAISEVLTKDGLEDSDDSDYTDFCERMKKAAQAISMAVEEKNAESARKAVGEINKACSECHENYRA